MARDTVLADEAMMVRMSAVCVSIGLGMCLAMVARRIAMHVRSGRFNAIIVANTAFGVIRSEKSIY